MSESNVCRVREDGSAFAVETTAIGQQCLVPGVAPITPLDRLIARAAAPLEPTKSQRACDLGLFNLNARNQLDLFQPVPPSGAAGHPVRRDIAPIEDF